MRLATPCLGIALVGLSLARASLADDPAPTLPSVAQMPANPVTSPAPADKDPNAAPTDSQRHGRDKHKQHGDAASAAPASTTPAAASDAAAQAPAAPKKVCRSEDVLGSKIPRRVCMTPDEWTSFDNRSREDTQDGLRRLRDQGAVAPPSPGVSPSQLPPTR
jgi:hypothetical protein